MLLSKICGVVNNNMDVLAGKSICDGANNFVQSSYQGIPVAITVEGAKFNQVLDYIFTRCDSVILIY